MVVLQSLALMDGQQSDAIVHTALDGFLVERVVPFVEEVVNVGHVVFEILGQLVEEGEDICTLVATDVFIEHGIDGLHHVVKRHGKQLFACAFYGSKYSHLLKISSVDATLWIGNITQSTD